jgi:3'-phosphoadenosine 5'-phosphosulfate sulfotransferase (PAPS reductase)/FAD synthetase
MDVKKILPDLLSWIKETVGDATVVIGISGGKDSSVAAALCAKALGKEKVIGVMMPDGYQHDQDASRKLIAHLGIPSYDINIQDITEASRESIRKAISPELTPQLKSNLGARIRMTTLYNVAAMVGNARVLRMRKREASYRKATSTPRRSGDSWWHTEKWYGLSSSVAARSSNTCSFSISDTPSTTNPPSNLAISEITLERWSNLVL